MFLNCLPPARRSLSSARVAPSCPAPSKPIYLVHITPNYILPASIIATTDRNCPHSYLTRLIFTRTPQTLSPTSQCPWAPLTQPCTAQSPRYSPQPRPRRWGLKPTCTLPLSPLGRLTLLLPIAVAVVKTTVLAPCSRQCHPQHSPQLLILHF